MTKESWSEQELLEAWLLADEEPVRDEQRIALGRLIVADAQVRESLIRLAQQQAWLMWHGSLGDLENDGTPAARIQAALQCVDAGQSLSDEQIALLLQTEEDAAAAAKSTPGPAPPIAPLPATDWSQGVWRSGMFFTLGLLVAVSSIQGLLLYRSRSQPRVALVAKANQPAAIAYLALANGCAWGNSASRLGVIGSSVHQGEEITLQEGIAEFRLGSGVSVSIEGPASLVLTSASSLTLQCGRLTAHVPWSVTDFKAVVSSCQFTACDAEFGVCPVGSNVDLHVFSGEVLVTSASVIEVQNAVGRGLDIVRLEDDDSLDGETQFLTKAVVHTGRSLSLAADQDGMKVVQWGTADETMFAPRLPMAWPLPITQTYVDAVLASDPVGYWRFESVADGVVANEIAGGMALNVVGDLELAGDAANRVVKCGRPGSNSCVVSPEPMDALSRSDYSVEIWVRPSHLHLGALVAIVKSQEESNGLHGFYLELEGAPGRGDGYFDQWFPGRLRFLHRDPIGNDKSKGTSCFSASPYRLRRWQHYVAVKSGSDMRLYIDGKMGASASDDTSLAEGLHMVVGRSQLYDPVDWFVGQLDELAVYNRALTQDEIEKHYEAVHRAAHRSTSKSDLGT